MTRKAPDLNFIENDGFASILAEGYDTVKETFDVSLPPALCNRLEEKREAGEEADLGKGDGVTVQLGAEDMQIAPFRGRGGQKWFIFSDDFRIFIRSPKMEWCLSVEYTAAGLWEYGVHELKRRILNMFDKEGIVPRCGHVKAADPTKWQRLSSVHYAYDFYSPDFTDEMKPEIIQQVICHSAVKSNVNGSIDWSAWAKAGYLETLTIGSKKSLQIQIYDKGKEITEASGKTWMIRLWEREGYHPPAPDDGRPKDVWRLEIRIAKNFLKNRKTLTLDGFEAKFSEIMAECLLNRRLTRQTADTNRARWPLHPIWTAAYRRINSPVEFAPMGRQKTESDRVKLERQLKSIAGSLRTATVLRRGDFDQGTFEKNAIEAQSIALEDTKHQQKIEKAKERYKYEQEAR